MVGHAGFLVAHDVALGGGNGVAVFLEACTVLDVEKETFRKALHVYALVVRRRGKGMVNKVGSGVGMGIRSSSAASKSVSRKPVGPDGVLYPAL